MKIKLYLIANEDGVVYAISEDKAPIKTYFKQREFDKSKYMIIKVKRKSLVNSLLRDMEDLYLIDEQDTIMTQGEASIIEEMASRELTRLQQTYTQLIDYTTRFNLSASEEKAFQRVITLLQDMHGEPELLDDRMNVKGIMGVIEDVDSVMRLIHERAENTTLYKDKIMKEGK